MSEDPMFREVELLKEIAPLPTLSAGLRSRVLAAALEAQDRRSQGRRVLVSALGLFAMLGGVAWMGSFSNGFFSNGPFANGIFANGPFSNDLFSGGDAQMSSSRFDGAAVDENVVGTVPGKRPAGAAAASALSSFNRASFNRASFNRASFNRDRGLMSVTGDDWRPVEAQLQSRQEHFSRFQM